MFPYYFAVSNSGSFIGKTPVLLADFLLSGFELFFLISSNLLMVF